MAEGIPGGSLSSESTPQDTSAFIKHNRPIDILFKPIQTNIYVFYVFFSFVPTDSDGDGDIFFFSYVGLLEVTSKLIMNKNN